MLQPWAIDPVYTTSLSFPLRLPVYDLREYIWEHIFVYQEQMEINSLQVFKHLLLKEAKHTGKEHKYM